MNGSARGNVTRRRLLRTALRLGGLAAAAPLLEACGRPEKGTPTLAPSSSPAPTPSGTVAPSPTAAPSATATPGATATGIPTATDNATATTRPTVAASPTATEEAGMAQVAFVKTRDRAEGVRRALELLGLNPVQGKQVLLKPNFNSADPAPGSTHPDTLRSLVEALWGMGARGITVADRSGMGATQDVMAQLGVLEMAEELGFEALALPDRGEEQDWVQVQPSGSHWERGFLVARACLEAEALVQTCCLKTHRFGGHFTLSLKNSVGMVAKFDPRDGYGYMGELHSSPAQRLMIAEINTAYTPALVVLDGVEAFTSQGPDRGQRAWGEVVVAGTDRVAIDAVGLALLRHLGCEETACQGAIFQQEQIARAVELGLGVEGPEKIRLVTGDAESEGYAAQIGEILLQG
jgi:uncharacterized protein (DUF362 family)